MYIRTNAPSCNEHHFTRHHLNGHHCSAQHYTGPCILSKPTVAESQPGSRRTVRTYDTARTKNGRDPKPRDKDNNAIVNRNGAILTWDGETKTNEELKSYDGIDSVSALGSRRDSRMTSQSGSIESAVSKTMRRSRASPNSSLSMSQTSSHGSSRRKHGRSVSSSRRI
ncbi:hypothetical protein Ahia01_000542100 [Argonauta hians]